MRTTLVACLLLAALASCSADPKSLTDSGQANLGRGQHAAALADFDAALAKIGTDTQDPDYLRAALGRCEALARVDPARATKDLVALAQAQKGRVLESDFSLIAHALLRAGTSEARKQAVDVVEAAHALFPDSPKLKAIGEAVLASATSADDPEQIKRLNSMGYGGGGR